MPEGILSGVIRPNLAQRGKGHVVFVQRSGWFLLTDYLHIAQLHSHSAILMKIFSFLSENFFKDPPPLFVYISGHMQYCTRTIYRYIWDLSGTMHLRIVMFIS
jgi:hypothetical protein